MLPIPVNFFNSIPLVIVACLYSALLLWFPGYFLWKHIKGLKKVIFSIISSILINQYILIIVGIVVNGDKTLSISTIMLGSFWAIVFIGSILKTQHTAHQETHETYHKIPSILMVGLIGITIILSIIPRLDLILDRSPEDHIMIAISTVHDDIKHIGNLNMIKENGINAPNPFYGEESLKYYIGYYVIPAALSKTFTIPSYLIWFLWTIITNIVWILSIFFILYWITKNHYIAFLLTLSGIIMGGWDILPSLYYNTLTYIETWKNNIGGNLQIPTPYVYFIFLPQHIFAITSTIIGSYYLITEVQKKTWFIDFATGFTLACITINSAYIGIFSTIFMIAYRLLEKTPWTMKIKTISWTILWLTLSILPLLQFFSGNDAGLKISYPTLLALSNIPWLTSLLALSWGLLLDLGWIIIGGIIGIIYIRKHLNSSNKFILFQVIIWVISLILVHFVSSKFLNDWGMKGSMFIVTSSLFLAANYIGNSYKKFLYFSPVILIGFATLVLTVSQLSGTYLKIEKTAYQALIYAEKNSSKDTIVVGDSQFYNSLIPALITRPTIVSTKSSEAFTVASKEKFTENNTNLQQIFSSTSEDELTTNISKLTHKFIFIIRNTTTNYTIFSNYDKFEKIYSNNQFSLFAYLPKIK